MSQRQNEKEKLCKISNVVVLKRQRTVSLSDLREVRGVISLTSKKRNGQQTGLCILSKVMSVGAQSKWSTETILGSLSHGPEHP